MEQQKQGLQLDLDTVKFMGKNGLLNEKGVEFLIGLCDQREAGLMQEIQKAQEEATNAKKLCSPEEKKNE